MIDIDIEAHMRAEREALEALPWFIRTQIKIGNFLRYRLWSWIAEFPQELKWDLQRFFKGYAEPDVWNLGFYIIDKLHGPLKEYVKNEAEHGISLPTEFASDPGAWLEVLLKIEFSVDDAWNLEHTPSYDPTKNMGVEEIEEHYKKVDEGFLLLGKYLRNIWN